jgi:hypothetical protein
MRAFAISSPRIQRPRNSPIFPISLFFSFRGPRDSGRRDSQIKSYLELGEGETTTGADPAVVPNGRASHDGAQLVDGTRSEGSSLGLTSSASPRLSAGLFEQTKVNIPMFQIVRMTLL